VGNPGETKATPGVVRQVRRRGGRAEVKTPRGSKGTPKKRPWGEQEKKKGAAVFFWFARKKEGGDFHVKPRSLGGGEPTAGGPVQALPDDARKNFDDLGGTVELEESGQHL